MIPDFLGSISTGIRYKNWNLRALFDMRFGGLVASYGSRYGTAYGYTKASFEIFCPEYGGVTLTSKYDGLTYYDGVIPKVLYRPERRLLNRMSLFTLLRKEGKHLNLCMKKA